MKKKKIFIIIISSIFVIACVLGKLFYERYNFTPLREGKIYYCTNNGAYYYNLKTRSIIKIDIDELNYDNVKTYLPLEDGYIACIENTDTDTVHYSVIYNASVVYESDNALNQFITKNKLLFFREGSNILNVLDLDSLQCSVISEKANYGFAFAENYLYYNERDPYQPEKESNIYILNYQNDELKKEVIDSGIVLRNTNNKLVYEKGDFLYSYDFENQKPVLIKDSNDIDFMEDRFENRFLGCVSIDNQLYQLHLKQFRFTPYDTNVFHRSEENGVRYETEAMQNRQQEQVCGTGYIKIRCNRQELSFPAIKLTYNDTFVFVSAIETGNTFCYPDIACTYCIY